MFPHFPPFPRRLNMRIDAPAANGGPIGRVPPSPRRADALPVEPWLTPEASAMLRVAVTSYVLGAGTVALLWLTS